MCGIVAVYGLNGQPVAQPELQRMSDVIRHRGPDGDGFFVDGAVGLAHRRLAIIDLSSAGRQPLANETGDVLVVYNGEIYNFQQLRLQLEAAGHRFRSKTDTEVIVHAYEQWGDDCVKHFNGMFAFALYDARDRPSGRGRLLIARDRYGVKPVYYIVAGHFVLIASEIKALLKHQAVRARVCHQALADYFTFQNVFSDLTLFEGVRLLPPATRLVVDCYAPEQVATNRFWDYAFASADSATSIAEHAHALREALDRAVARQLVSDVPVGSYLSGGIDSGSITALASRHIPRMHTFTAGFDLSSASGLELGFDERPASELMSNLFKTEHYEVVLHAGDMERVLPTLVWHLEDLRVGQCYPNFYVARLASKFVKVVLSGAGGDELFGGYPWRYYRGSQAETADAYFNAYYDYWQRLIPDEDRRAFYNDATYREVRQYNPRDSFRAVFDGGGLAFRDVEDVVNASFYFELKTFLHALFVVEDKISMAHSVETRVPFIDDEVVDLALRIPPRHKLRELKTAPFIDEDDSGKVRRTADGKIVLRIAVDGIVPEEIGRRPKHGFSAPDASWFRGESIDYVNGLVRSPNARLYEFFQPEYIGRMLDEHTAGVVNHRLLIWSLLSFESWLRIYL